MTERPEISEELAAYALEEYKLSTDEVQELDDENFQALVEEFKAAAEDDTEEAEHVCTPAPVPLGGSRLICEECGAPIQS